MDDTTLTKELPAVERPIYVKCRECKARLDDVGSAGGELCIDCEQTPDHVNSRFIRRHFGGSGK